MSLWKRVAMTVSTFFALVAVLVPSNVRAYATEIGTGVPEHTQLSGSESAQFVESGSTQLISASISSGWATEGTNRYYYNSDGSKYTGELHDNGSWYYLDPANGGAMATGKVKLPSGKIVYYGTNGSMLYGVQEISNVGRVYLDPTTGQLSEGERFISGKWYFFQPGSGVMASGITRLPTGKTVYYGPDGAMRYGLQLVQGVGYRSFDKTTGALQTGFMNSEGSVYYINSDASALTGQVCLSGKWYYFDPNNGGIMATGFATVPDSYYGTGEK